MDSQKACKKCGKVKPLSDFRKYRLTCRKCCYQIDKKLQINWISGKPGYSKAKGKRYRQNHPLHKKLVLLRRHDPKSKGLLKILEGVYSAHPWCEYCGIALNATDVSLDHKMPISRGGEPCNPDNWAISCHDCNYLKRARTYHEFQLFKIEYAKRLLANAEPSPRNREGVTVSPEITDISAPALD